MPDEDAMVVGKALLNLCNCNPEIQETSRITITWSKLLRRWYVYVEIDGECASIGEAENLKTAMIAAELINIMCQDCPLPGIPGCPGYPKADCDESD
jgi:hypothetical protein